MLACIACSKPELEDGGGAGDGATSAGTRAGHNKDAVKSLTTQIKDMVLKFSGTYRQCKGGTSGGYRPHHRQHHRSTYDVDGAASDGGGHYAYLTAGSSTSTPAWDFTSITADSRFAGRAGGTKWIPGVGEVDQGVVLEEDNGEPKEWMAQVEPGVHITFISLPGGTGNDLKRIRFNREMFNKWQAQRWWGENYDRIMELYNVQRFSRQALTTPPRSEDGERESVYSRVGSTRGSPATPPLSQDRSSRNMTHGFRPPPPLGVSSTALGKGGASSVPDPTEHIMPAYYLNPAGHAGSSVVKGEAASSVEASRTTTSSRDEAASVSVSNASEMDQMTEWVEQDEPGVYITIRELADGSRELRRVRFSREKFGEVHAKLWWEENRERIQAQYL